MKNPPPFVSVLESLEPKIAPAGVVSVVYNAVTNSMIISGSAGNDDFIMTHTAGDTWKFTSTNGDTAFSLNGVAAGFEINNMPVTLTTKINLGDGNDKLVMTSTAAPGAELVILEGLFEVLGGKGVDNVSIHDELNPVFNGLTKFDLGDGYDSLQFEGTATFANKTLLSAGLGGGDITIGPFGTQTFTKGLTVDLGSGGGLFTGDLDVSGGKLEIKAAGTGGSLLYLDGGLRVEQGMSISLGTGNNTVALGVINPEDIMIGGPLSITTGGGSDSVIVFTEVNVSGAFTIDMKDGTNSFALAQDASVNANSVLLKGGKAGLDVQFGSNAALTTSTSFTVDVKANTLEDNLFNITTGSTLKIGSIFSYLGGTRNDQLDFGANVDVDIRGGMIASLGAGANGVNFGNADVTIGGNLSVTGLTGNDSVSMTGELNVLGSILMNLGAGTNFFNNSGGDVRVAGALSYTGGAGNDSIDFGGVDLLVGQSLTIAAGDGDNQVMLHGTNGQLSSIIYTGGKGQDQVYVGVNAQGDAGSTYLTGGVTAKLGAGLNRLVLAQAVVRSAVSVQSLSATAETDFLTVRDATVFGTFTSALGKGVSTLTIDDSTFNNAVNVTTGDGNDVLKFDNLAGPEYSGVNRWNSAVKILSGTGDDQFIFGTGNGAPSATNTNIFRNFSSIFDSGTGADTVQQNGGQTLSGNAYNVPVS
ncbi:beta strand repeat-containing protein [Brevifollis gellanilyticus]|uniref:Uncharacterized protein n=1 Tax=Brevifollis gellanilyticus TaxID=748831 RepID=A0A512MAU9_9BACT|nr:hypothetical protein [Brevifollis gellanilyticus]GEP43865.1 hypothetical protein BGE01nite_31560 [Brevifollis gellanilyticus]